MSISIVAAVMIFTLLVVILILGALNCKETRTLAKNTTKKENNMKADQYRNLLVSVIKHLTSDQSEFSPVSVVDSSGLITFATTATNRIIVIPTYHNVKDQVENFLQNTKETQDVYVVVDGEPNPIPQNKKIDIVITTKRDEDENCIYVPYYALYAQQYQKPIQLLFEPSLPYRTSFSNWNARSLMVFAYSNDNTTRYEGCAKRSLFYQNAMKKFGSRVHNHGKQCGNNKVFTTDNIDNNGENYYFNDNLYKQFKFVIAFENSQIRGYVSEKIINPFLAGCIPIYLGADDIDDHINPESFINVSKYENFQACLDDIAELEYDENRIAKMLSAPPFLHDKFLDYLKLKGGNVWKKLMKSKIGHLIPLTRVISNRVAFMTFGHNSDTNTKRIEKEAYDSKYFDDINCLGLENIPYEFIEKHNNFLNSSPKEYGMKIWKSILIQKKMQTMCEDDILVYCDSTEIISDQNRQDVLENQYQKLIESPDASILAFETHLQEFAYTKTSCIDNILSTEGIEKSEKIREKILKSPQLSSKYIIFKKCEKSMNFIAKWVYYASLVDLLTPDNISKEKRETGHIAHNGDQSIFSCLMKIENQIILPSK